MHAHFITRAFSDRSRMHVIEVLDGKVIHMQPEKPSEGKAFAKKLADEKKIPYVPYKKGAFKLKEKPPNPQESAPKRSIPKRSIPKPPTPVNGKSVAFLLAIEALEVLKQEIKLPDVCLETSDFSDRVVIFRDSNNKEFARVNFQLKRIVTPGKNRVVKNFDWKFVTLSTLKSEGWKESDLYEFLGKPLEVPNPHYKSSAPMKLWPLHWATESANLEPIETVDAEI